MLPLLLARAATAHVPVVFITDPTEDWCAVINGTVGNDIVMLLPGTYEGPCDIVAEVSDVDYELTTVQSFDPADPATLVPGDADYILSASGHRLILFQLQFEDIPDDVVPIRVDGLREMWVRQSWFRRIPGTVVAFRAPVLEAYHVEDNEFTDIGVGAEIGCPDGSCVAGWFQTEDNLVTRAGLAFLVGPGNSGIMDDDVVVESTTAVRLLGAGDVTLEGGLYEGTGPVIDIVDGPALIDSSVVIGSTIALRAAGDTMQDVAIVGSTIVGGAGAALDLTGWGPGRGLRVVNTALDEALAAIDGVDLAGSLGCPDPAVCFTDVARWDFYPPPGSPLRDAGVSDPEMLVDWCGRARVEPPCVGAFEGILDLTMRPLEPVAKRRFDCEFLEGATGTTTTPPTGGTDGPTDTGNSPETDGRGGNGADPEGCGCAASLPPHGLLVVPALLVLLRRRRP